MDSAYLSECFDYCVDTGALIWKERPLSHFKSERYRKAFATRNTGCKAGTIDKQTGYIKLSISDKSYLAHRLVLMLHGENVEGVQVDHINGVKHDNSLSNLRLVDTKDNAMNQKTASNNTSGFIGVTWHKPLMKWRATISNGKLLHLGYFDNISDAIKVRLDAEESYGYHANHGRV